MSRSILRRPRFKVRYMVHADLSEVARIDRECFLLPWDHSEFRARLRKKRCIGRVAEWNDEVIGYVVHEMAKRVTEITRMAVVWDFERRGVGSALMREIKKYVPKNGELAVMVRERSVEAQLFFRDHGFRYEGTHRKFYPNGEDAYVMTFQQY